MFRLSGGHASAVFGWSSELAIVQEVAQFQAEVVVGHHLQIIDSAEVATLGLRR
ncbi:MAG: hypothetical protein R3B91_09470 [Planctomycetaceae bacterium]